MTGTGRVSWVNYNNKQVLYCDYSGLSGKELLNVLYESKSIMEQAGKDLLVISDFTGAIANPTFVSEIKEAGKGLDAAMKRASAVGMNAMQKILYNGYLRFTGQHKKTRSFDTKEQALAWVTEE